MITQSALLPTQFVMYGDKGYDSHILRFLLNEKQIEHTFYYLPHIRPNELAELNPYQTLPILVNRDVALYEFLTIFEYLEERHPAIKLLPATPKDRALVRQLAWRINHDWLSLAKVLLTHADSYNAKKHAHAHKALSDILITLSPIFDKEDFFLSKTIGLCDIILTPMLWRLDEMGIALPKHLCQALLAYQHRLTQRPAFIKTLQFPQAMEFFDD